MSIERLARRIWQQGDQVINSFFDDEFMDNYVLSFFHHFGLAPNFFHNPVLLKKFATHGISWFPQQGSIENLDRAQQDERLNTLTQSILDADVFRNIPYPFSIGSVIKDRLKNVSGFTSLLGLACIFNISHLK